ncbi:MAG: IclR family transcriptional regulator [Actinomadura sp.]
MTQSLERALLLLEELGSGPKRLGPLADRLGIHKSTALRLLQTLERRGYVRRQGEVPEFSLGLRLVELSSSLLEKLDVREIAAGPLKTLGEATGETVHLAVLEGPHVVYLDKVESIHPVRMYSRVGARADAYCTGVGKVLLAFTDPGEWPAMEMRRHTENTITSREEMLAAAKEIRSRGWGWDEREHEDTIRCIAAPVFGPERKAVAAVSVSVPTSRLTAEELQEHVPLLLEASEQITRGLGGRPPQGRGGG